jgi:hypothetical protein
MVNPRWRPEIANSRVPLKGPSNITKTVKPTLPPAEEYIGTYIEGDLGGVKVSNKSYKKYYKGMV